MTNGSTAHIEAGLERTERSEGMSLAGLIADLATLCRELGREELAAHAERQLERLERESMVVLVAGEYKRGKSSLVNALLRRDVCPVAATQSTDVPTIVRYGDRENVSLTLTGREGHRVVEMPIAALPEAALGDMARDAGRERKVVAVVELRNAFLEEGFTLIDSPGTGGLSPGFQESVANLAQVSDVALVVVDAGSPLTPWTMDFIERLAIATPAVAIVATRTDLYRRHGSLPEIREQLKSRGIDLAILPVSCTIRRAAYSYSDDELDNDSGLPALETELRRRAGERDERARITATREVERVMRVLERAIEPSGTGEPSVDWDARLEEERDALETARRNGARWATLLNEGGADAAALAEHELRTQLREAGKSFDEELDATRRPANPEDLRARVLARAETAMSGTLSKLAERLASLESELLHLFEPATVSGIGLEQAHDLPEWTLGDKRPEARLRTAAGTVYSSLKGAQTGIIMVGVFAGIAGFGIGTLAILGIGTAFGARQILDERGKRSLTRSQQIKAAIRQYFDEVYGEGSRAIREITRQELRRQREVLSELAVACVAARTSQYRWAEDQRAKARLEQQGLERQREAARVAFLSLKARVEATS